ncbi:hypothetical protein J004_01223 [Cryptococcus neoformans]|nr:hypothetical protein J004_01223 [Cryptococcus neoformans var. grubii]
MHQGAGGSLCDTFCAHTAAPRETEFGGVIAESLVDLNAEG